MKINPFQTFFCLRILHCAVTESEKVERLLFLDKICLESLQTQGNCIAKQLTLSLYYLFIIYHFQRINLFGAYQVRVKNLDLQCTWKSCQAGFSTLLLLF